MKLGDRIIIVENSIDYHKLGVFQYIAENNNKHKICWVLLDEDIGGGNSLSAFHLKDVKNYNIEITKKKLELL